MVSETDDDFMTEYLFRFASSFQIFSRGVMLNVLDELRV